MYVWDSENRLIEVRPTNPDPNDIKVTYAYDYRGRRFERKLYVRDANDVQWDLEEHRKFLYDGQRLLLELVVDPNDPNDPDSDTVAMKYTWGLDLLSQFSGGATVRGSGGGIGALLAVWDADDPNGVHAVLHDANGNVVEVLSPATDPNDPNTAIVAHYEYDVYGNRINPLDPNDPNDTEFEQPFRYASKWRDPDTGLVDFGRRWYFADHGRWLNRDPIGTAGGVNVYAYVMNSPVNQIDPLGLAWLPCPYADGCPPLYGASPFCPGDEEGGGGGYNGGGNDGGGEEPDLPEWDWGGTPIPEDDDPLAPPIPPVTTPPGIGAVTPSDNVQLFCFPIAAGLHHCDVRCEGSDGSVQWSGGTGPFNGSGGPDGNGNPGWERKKARQDHVVASKRMSVPPGTCQCISDKGAKLNGIAGKGYSYLGPNSNSALSLVLGCCGVDVSPSVSAPGWGEPVNRPCKRPGSHVDWVRGPGGDPIPVDKPSEVHTSCPIRCSDLE